MRIAPHYGKEIEMNALLKVVGIVWAVVGAVNLMMLPFSDKLSATGEALGQSTGTMVALGIITNMILFVVPGLVLFALGNRK